MPHALAARVASTADGPRDTRFVPASVRMSKRTLDIACALAACALLAVLVVPIALAIRVDSRGPLFCRQPRVGRASPTENSVFQLITFRTLPAGQEPAPAAMWAGREDPRLTRVGRWLRAWHLDGLPQWINVLKGDMSVIGPQPERPQHVERLDNAIPFYAERAWDLKPGLTGLAQVSSSGASLDDVRDRVLYDHAYAVHLASWREWLRTDFDIFLATLKAMRTGITARSTG